MNMRMEVQDEHGVWREVQQVRDLTFEQHLPDPRAQERIASVARERWTMSGIFEPEPGVESLHDLIQRLEREAIARRFAARLWLSHPYRARGVIHV